MSFVRFKVLTDTKQKGSLLKDPFISYNLFYVDYEYIRYTPLDSS